MAHHSKGCLVPQHLTRKRVPLDAASTSAPPPQPASQERRPPPRETNPFPPATPPPSYVDKAYAKAGTELNLVVRGKAQKAVVTKMHFVQTTYYKG